ncbi:MAG: hypothetical protein FJ271_09245 [Planctomycetes bacterium]|nr:hypothetical protein [Planctomycetota bacterium]
MVKAVRKKRKQPEFIVPVPPTPEEIAERCLEIQAEWSSAERAKRDLRALAEYRPVSFSPGRIALDMGALGES